MKKWISVLLVCVFMIGMLPADALAVEDQFTMTDAQVQQISKLAGSETSTYRKGMSFSASMSAYQMYCWLSELSENTAAQAQRQFSSLSRLLEKTPEFKEKPGFERFNEVSTNVDRLGAELNYYLFQLDEDVRLVSNALSTLKQKDSDDAERTKAYRMLQKAERSLNGVMSKLSTLQAEEPMQTRAAGIIDAVAGMMEAREALMKNLLRAETSPAIRQTGDFHFVVMNYDQIGFVILDENEQRLQGAKVRVVSGKKEQTVISDQYGIALFTAGYFKLNEKNRMTAEVYVTASGKRNFESHALHLTAGEGRNIYLEEDDGQSYIQYMDFRGVDILHETETVYTTDANDANQQFKVGIHTRSGHGGTFSVIYTEADTRVARTVEKNVSGTADKVVELDLTDRWCSMLEPRMAVTTAFAENGSSVSEAHTTGVAVKPAAVKSPLPTLPGSQVLPGSSAMLNIPLDLPLLKNLQVGFNFPSEILDSVPVSFVVTPEGYFSLGISVTKSQEFKDDATQETWKTTNSLETRDAMEKLIDNRETLTSLAQQGIQKRTDSKANFLDLSKMAFRFNFTAMVTGTVDPDVTEQYYNGALDVFVSVAGDATVSFCEPFMLGPVPVYAGFDFSVGLMFGVNVGFKFKTDNLNAIKFDAWRDFEFDREKLDIVLSPRMSIGIYGGVGVKKVLGFYIRAYAGAVLAVHYRPAADGNKLAASASINIGVEGVLELLFLKFKATFVDKTWSGDTAATKMVSASATALRQDTTDSNALDPQNPETFVQANIRALPSSVEIPAGMDVFMWEEAEPDAPIMMRDPTFLGIRKTNAVINGVERPWLDAVEIICSPGFIGGKPVVPMEIPNLGRRVWPNGIPADAYVVDFAATSIDEVCRDGVAYKAVAVAVVFAQHANDDADGRATKCMGEMHYLFRDANGNVTYLAGDKLDMTEGFSEKTGRRDIHGDPVYEYFGYDGSVYGLNVMAHYDTVHSTNGNDVYYFTASWVKEDAFFWHGQTFEYNGKTPSIRALTLSEGHLKYPIPYVPESAQLYVTMVDGKAYDVTVMYEPSIGTHNMLLNKYYYERPDCEPGLQWHDSYHTLVHVEVDDSFNSKLVYLRDKDETGACDVVVDGYKLERYTDPRLNHYKRTGSTYLDARLSPAEISIVNFGATRALYYVEQSFVNVEESQSCYGLKAVYLADGSDGKPYISKPFYLAKFNINDVPVEANIISCKLFRNPNGFLNGIAVLGKPDGAGNMKPSTDYFSFNQTLQVDVRGSAIENQLLKSGDTGNLLFNVKNTGNIPVSQFKLEAYALNSAGESKELADIVVSCQDPENSKVFGFNMGETLHSGGTGRVGVSEFAYAIDEGYDQLTAVTNGSSTTYATNVLMPGETHSYRATFRVPNDFAPDEYDAFVKPSTISTIAIHGQGGSLDSTAAWIKTMYDLDAPDTGANESGTPLLGADIELLTVTAVVVEEEEPLLQSGAGRDDALPAAAQDAPVQLVIEGKLGSDDDNLLLKAYSDRTQVNASQFDMTFADLSVQAQPMNAAGTDAAHIVIQNGAATPVKGVVLTAAVDGEETFRHAFDAELALDGMNTFALDIPMEKLTDGRKGEELVLNVACDGGDLNDFNNHASIPLQNSFAIAGQPKDQFVYVGDTAAFDVLVRGGTEPYSYQWQWSDSRTGKAKKIAGANERTLTIENAQTDYTGRYLSCVVRDADGEKLVSQPALLSVAVLPPTGDTNDPAMLAVLMLLSLAVLAVLARKARRKG